MSIKKFLHTLMNKIKRKENSFIKKKTNLNV